MHRSAWLGVMGIAMVACAAARRAPAGAGPAVVRPGIEVLLADSAALVRGRRVGLVTNNTGVDRAGTNDVDRLRTAGVRLTALFSPEHGFRGAADPGAAVASGTDSATGLPIYSLYGRTTAPTPAMLEGLDVLLVDLQDAGARYFTYLFTAVEVMRSAGRAGIPVVILDRPNPVGGAVQGNVLDTAQRSTVGLLAVPMRHGLTLGELADLARRDLGIAVDLHVVPVGGWRRGMAYDATGLPFVPPSPNLRSVEALFHYPGTCLFEGTNLSVGRGTGAPFEQVGAPWLDPSAVLASLAGRSLPGVAFEAVTFTPRRPGDGKFADTAVAGIRLRVTDRAAYDPTATAVALLWAIRRTHPDRFAWIARHFDRLAGQTGLREAIDRGDDPALLVEGWTAGRQAFLARRAPVIRYPD